MNTRLILDDPDRVAAFVGERIGRPHPWWKKAAIGIERGGELLAGVVFENWTDRSVEAHIAALPGRRWARPDFFAVCFRYAFLQLDVEIMYAHVRASNIDCCRLVEHLGFREVVILEGAAVRDDLIIYAIRRSECRYLAMESHHVPAKS